MRKNNFMYFPIYLLAIALLSDCSKDKNDNNNNSTNSKLSVSDLTKAEGNGGTTQFDFTVSLDKASSKTVTVNYSTVAGTALAAQDFTAAAGTLSFQPNETSKSISISVVADDLREGDESFTIQLSGAANASISKGTGLATILNDDVTIPMDNTGYDAPSSYPGYTLLFADEFNGTSLDQNIWSFENGDGCPGNCGWGNNELEYYQPNNTFFQDGKLVIEARPENVGGKSYTSSKILTRGKKFFKFGRIDIRAKLPKGQGIWPAFWMLPQDNIYGGWPTSGEIDIMEMIGHQANRTYGTLHFGPGPGSTQLGGNYTLPSGIFNDQFHVFSIIWQNNSIQWLVDNVPYSTHTNAEVGAATYPFNENFFLIFNMAVGGNWPGSPDATTSFPQWLIVDYMRVYQ